MRRRWIVTVGENKHLIEADLALSSRETVWVDRVQVYNQMSMKLKNDIPVEIEGQKGLVRVRMTWYLMGRPSLEFAGRAVQPYPNNVNLPAGLLKALADRNPTAGAEAQAETPAAQSEQVPWWAWPFVAACGVIPILTLGGAIPGAVGFGGAAFCYQISAKQDTPAWLRAVICMVITGLAWGIVLALGVTVGVLKRAPGV